MKIKILIIIIFILAVGVYLNRAYAYIYQKIGSANLKYSDQIGTYIIKTPGSVKNLTYVALGDSLTAGVGTDHYEQSFPYLLAQKMATDSHINVTLKDLAAPGVKTQDLLKNFVPAAIADQPEVITVLIGVNDIHGNISEKDFQTNYQQILTELTAKTKAKIYLINLPEIGSNSLLWPPYNYYFHYQTKQFNKIIKDLADQFKLAYIDLDAPTANLLKQDGAYYSIDDFHPSASGYLIWSNIIYADFHR